MRHDGALRVPRTKTVALLAPALATRVDVVPLSDDWQHEPKIDGYRIQCHVQGSAATLLSRNGLDYSDKFPVVADAAIALLGGRRAVLDGEVVVPTADGQSPFQSLQVALRSGTARTAVFWVFDLLVDGRTDLRARPLDERRIRLATRIGEAGNDAVIRMVPTLDGSPETLLQAACARGEEGIISKRRDAPYQSGRSRGWLKIKCTQRDEFVIVGYSDPEGSRTHFGALLLASRAAQGGVLRYAGRVGSGFTDRVLADLHRRLRGMERATPVVEVPRAVTRGVHWVEPALVADVAFAEWTSDRVLRHATFQGLRDDKETYDVKREAVSRTATVAVTTRQRAKKAMPPSRTVAPAKEGTCDTIAGVKVSHADRVIYPEIGLTKGDLAAYYEAVAPLMLPHVAGRPLSTVRCPDGPHQSCFFQKHWKPTRGAAVRTVAIDEHDGAGGDYAVATTAHDLVALVQWNVIELHTWESRTDVLEAPDRLVLDLDPGPGVRWKTVCDGARYVRALLDDASLQSWVKLSGGKGVHITIPLDRRITWQQLSGLARLIAGRLVHDHPTMFVDVAAKDRRNRRIFVDWMRNSRGATAVAPWSVRARTGAPVSVPIDWADLEHIGGPDVMSVPVVRKFLESRPLDPWRDMLTTRQRLTARVLDALAPSDP